MLTCHYSDVLRQAAQVGGLGYPLDVDSESGLRVSITNVLEELYTQADFPEICTTEQRTYRPAYAGATAYPAGTEVFYLANKTYYISLTATTGNAPALESGGVFTLNSAYWAESQAEYSANNYSSTTAYVRGQQVYYPTTDQFYQLYAATSTGNAPSDTTKWGVLTPFSAYIDLDQAGQTPIGAVLNVYDRNPELTTRVIVQPWFETENGIQVINGVNQPWVNFKRRPPVLTGELLDLAATYAAGEQVQWAVTTNGVEVIDFYDCVSATTAGQTPVTHPAKWSLVEIPRFFKVTLGASAVGEFLIGDDDARAEIANSVAQRSLSVLLDNLYRTQGQVPRTKVRTY